MPTATSPSHELSIYRSRSRVQNSSRRRRFWAAAATAAAAAAACAAPALQSQLRAFSAPSPVGGGFGGGSAAAEDDGVAPRVSFRERVASLMGRRGSEWDLCAPVEGATCQCVGTAALHTWTGDWAMLRHTNGSIRCTSDAFGEDPRPHFAKVCSCFAGPRWPLEVVDGLNETIARKLVARIEVGPPGAGCDPASDGAWLPCAVMSTRYDASVIPDRYLPMLPPAEQADAALRKLDVCHRMAGGRQAIRILGVLPAKQARASLVPVMATKASMCAVVYEPGAGIAWEGREAVFCPTTPPQCLPACECADDSHKQINVRAGKDDDTECWACVPAEEATGEVAPPPEGPMETTV
mmetsp:Transcript_106150/g.269596  ORF Transcript_106150/g.269596 Transcript_106150/m.269596 type:complete len:352 (-) Transcript_106150:139-1194(-)